MSPAYRRLLKISRQVHLYVTLFGLALIVFFSVTGFMLNNESWFSKKKPDTIEEEDKNVQKGTMPIAFLNPIEKDEKKEDGDDKDKGEEKKPLKPVDKFEVTEWLRKEFKIRGEFDKKRFREEEDRVEIYFVRPGEEIHVEIERETGATTVRSENEGWAGVVMDLHKGKNTGKLWSYIIDVLSVMLVIASFTGLILWSSLKSRGKWGAILLFLGTGITFGAYYFIVP